MNPKALTPNESEKSLHQCTFSPFTETSLEPKSVIGANSPCTVNQMAFKVREAGKQVELEVKVNNVPNPRLEAEDHYCNPVHTGLLELGLKPHYLTEEVLTEMLEVALRYKANIKEHAIFRGEKRKQPYYHFLPMSAQGCFR